MTDPLREALDGLVRSLTNPTPLPGDLGRALLTARAALATPAPPRIDVERLAYALNRVLGVVTVGVDDLGGRISGDPVRYAAAIAHEYAALEEKA